MIPVGAMQKKIKNININYLDYGNKNGDALVLLHGWGQNLEMMLPFAKPFSQSYHIIIIDLPGFGRSEIPNLVLSIEDYADIIKELLDSLNIKTPILIGHSFGGQIALFYSSKYGVKKLILLASPFRPRKVKKTFKSRLFHIIKKTPILKNHLEYFKSRFGSTDYRNAKGVMRDILVKKVNLDMTNELEKVLCPTLIVWGTNDTAVPVDDASFLKEHIINSELIIYENASHYAYLERLEDLVKSLKEFLERK